MTQEIYKQEMGKNIKDNNKENKMVIDYVKIKVKAGHGGDGANVLHYLHH